MKRNFTLTLLLVFASFLAKAQLPDGSIAPNFTVIDIEGNTHTLYDYLDQGKTVVIDFMVTWSGSAWDYYNTDATTDLYNLYGPDGTDEMVVLMIESDDNTELDCLFGQDSCIGGTVGDWVTDSPFPVINDHTIRADFEVNFFPTIYHICPNRIIVEAGEVSTAVLYGLNDNCLSVFGNNNAGILEYTGFQNAFCGSETFAPIVKFQNLGLDNMTSATFEVALNGSVAESMNWTGDLSTYGYTDIVFSDVTVTDVTTLEVNITTVNGVMDEDDSNNLVSVDIPLVPQVDEFYLTLEIQTDNFPGETSWGFYDANGNIVASGGGYDTKDTLYVEPITLPDNGCFEFVIYDSYGDGICCTFGNGFYKLMDNAGNTIFEGNDFADSFTEGFQVDGATAVRELDSVTGLTLFPNPARSELNIQFNLTESMPLNVTVFNTLGQLVTVVSSQDFTLGQHTLNVDVANLSNGVYFVRFANGEKQLTSKFTVLN